MKQMGARNAGNPHVACDVEGAGDVERSRYRPTGAPVLDPTCATRAAHRGFQIVEEHGGAGISGGKGRDKCPAFGSVSDRAIRVGLSEGDAAEGQAASRIRSTMIPRVKKRWRRALGGRFRCGVNGCAGGFAVRQNFDRSERPIDHS
jgi:hypothetical protein